MHDVRTAWDQSQQQQRQVFAVTVVLEIDGRQGLCQVLLQQPGG